MSLGHILVIIQYFKLFHYYIFYGDLWSIIFDAFITERLYA